MCLNVYNIFIITCDSGGNTLVLQKSVSGPGPVALYTTVIMKRQHFYFLLVFILFVSSSAFPQTYRFPKDSADNNPFKRNRVIKNEQEIMILTDNVNGSATSGVVQHKIYNLSPIPSLLPSTPYSSIVFNEGSRHLSAATGDFNNDSRHEVIAAWQTGQDIFLSLPSIDPNNFNMGSTVSTFIHTAQLAAGTNGGNAGRMIIKSGDFDDDGQSEAVIAYRNSIDGLLHIQLFDIDSATFAIQSSGNISDEVLSVLNAQAYEPFDMITKDIDYDGRDEIIVTGIHTPASNHHIYVKIYKVSGSGSNLTLIPKARMVISDFIASNKEVFVKIACGDFNGDLLQEIAIAYNYQLDSYPSSDPDTYIKVIRVADSTATSPSTPDYLESIIDSGYIYGVNQNENDIYNFCMVSADCNRDGHDEIITSYDGAACRIFKVDDYYNISLVSTLGQSAVNASLPLYDNFLAVGDMDRDGYGDIINVRNSINENSIPFQQELNIHVIRWDPLISNFAFHVSLDAIDPVDETNSGGERQFTIAMGDFDNDRIRFGNPKKFVYSKMTHPLVVLNSPPVHFDTLPGGIVTDVAGVYPSPPVNPDFSAAYTTLSSQALTMQTKENSDWNVSLEIKYQDSLGGTDSTNKTFEVEAYIKGTYGEKFSETQSKVSSVTQSTLNTAYTDDLIYGWITDYLVHEYPVLIHDTLVGYITSLVPFNGQKTWFGGNDPLGYEVNLNHEPGNILSYPQYLTPFDDPDLKQVLKGDFPNISLGPSSSFQWEMTFSEINTTITDTVVHGSISAGLGGGAGGFSVKLEGSYNFENTSTLTNTIQSDIKFEINMGPLSGGIADPNYKVSPYLMWAKNGSAVLNYSVVPEIPSTGFPSSWWWQNYQVQDPALILPWRLYPEKGFPLVDQSKRTLSKSIWFDKTNPAPGDTVVINVRVHNFSVSPTNTPVVVSFYLGDPDNGGIPITDTSGLYTVSTLGILQNQGREIVQFVWVAPPNLLSDPRLFAWLDESNTMTEVHEGNNLGWIPLGINYPLTGIEGVENIILTGTFYPNPASEFTYLPVSLLHTSTLAFEFYTVQGVKVFEKSPRLYSPGEHIIEFGINELSSGIYICKMISGDKTTSTKLVIAGSD